MTTSGNTFGRYTLLGRIAVGGMAEVYRGKFAGEKGFEKPVVIKRMLPQIASDEQMVQFFIDEARLSALLQHENIVCIYDFGELDETYFLAMEYLRGQNLNDILKKAADLGMPPNLGDILWVASRLCNGLEYAHTLKDLTGRPLNIVHRDISPQNVFVTYGGNVKILDFGVAKTTMQTAQTKVGIAKGKMAYMSPEQLEANAIDHRSDIFAVGILLYEMVTQSHMYSGPTTAEIFKQVMHAQFEPPEDRNPSLDPKLAAIINKALQKNPADRFQSCHEMQAAIEDCIFRLSLRPSNKTLSKYVVSLFPEGYSENQPQHTSEKDISPFDDGAGTMDKTQSLSRETAAVDFGEETMADGAGVQFASSSESSRPLGSPPEIKTRNTPDRAKGRMAGAKVYAAVFTAVVLFMSIASAVFFLFKKASTSEMILELLLKAESRIEANQLTTPEHDCAVFYYDEVLKLDPDNETVTKGYEKIAAKYAVLAEGALMQFQYGRARSLTLKGLESKPGDERLLNLNQQITQELIQRAESCIAANQLTTPENDCAAFYYREMLKFEPGSDAAEKGFGKIAVKYADLAEEALTQFQYHNARSLTAKGLEVKPDDERLLGLDRQIKEELLQKAENCLEANRLTTPKYDCAVFYYDVVSELYPGSDAAEKGYEEIAGKYADLAEKARTQFRYGNARSLTAKGLELRSDDERLLNLNRQIKRELLQRAENCINANRLSTPEDDCAAVYYEEVLKLFSDRDAVEKGYEKIAQKYADLAESAMKQFEFDNARHLAAKGLEFKPDDERLLSLNRQLNTNKVGLFLKNIGKGIKDSID